MSDLEGRLSAIAEQEGLPLGSVARRHLLQGVLRRWARSSQAGAFVLRGGLMTQLWAGAGQRATQDIDLVGLYPTDMIETRDRLHEVLAVPADDGVVFDLDTLFGQVIWEETGFPGHRFVLQTHLLGQESELQIDVGFGDPLVPAAEWIEYPCLTGPVARILAVTPELLVAWKLDGLFDHGPRRWQPKDLHDLYLLTRHCSLDVPTLTEAIRVAFEAHADPLEEVPQVVYSRSWWEKESSRGKWAKYVASARTAVPEDLVAVAAEVARALRPALARLVACREE